MPPRTPAFEVRRSGIHGRGVFALRTIRRGTRVVEYTGERISHEEAQRRYVDTPTRHRATYLFALDAKQCIDAAVGGNEARFINHSCAPNCDAVAIDGRIYVVARQTIRRGDELTYDYWLSLDGELDAASVARIYACRCGAPACRGTMLRPAAQARPRPSPRRRPSRKRAVEFELVFELG